MAWTNRTWPNTLWYLTNTLNLKSNLEEFGHINFSQPCDSWHHDQRSNFHLNTADHSGKNWLSGHEAPAVHRGEENEGVELFAWVEQEVDKVDRDDNDECLGLLDSGKEIWWNVNI